MKKLTFTVLALFLVVGLFAQGSFYWAAYHFEVKPGHENDVVSAFDRFFDSETGKKLPAAGLDAAIFGSSKDDFTHTLVFFSQDKADIGGIYSGFLQQSPHMWALSNTLDNAIKGTASYLGKSLINGPPNPSFMFSNIYEMSVKDPAAYAPAFSKFRDGVLAMTGGKVSLDLHQFLSGNEPDATHVVVMSAASVTDILDALDMVFGSQEFADYNAKVKDNRTLLRVFTTVNAKQYNFPDGM